MNQLSHYLSGLCCSLLSFSFLFAIPPSHDRIALAYPLSGITIDGSIDDWTQDLMQYPISNALFGAKAEGAEDFSAYYMCGYDQEANALLLAVVIKDDIEISKVESPAWNNIDTYTLYLNEAYRPKGSGVARYTMRDNYRDLTDITDNWDPQLKAYLDWEKVEMKTQRIGNVRTYELKVQLNEPIYDGRIMGLGHMINDQDKVDDQSVIYGWVGSGGKSSSPQPGRIGMIVFQSLPGTMGRVKGKVAWEDPEISTRPEGIHIASAENPAIWMYLPVNEAFEFEAILPKGQYFLQPGKIAFFNGDTYFKADANHRQTFEVKAGKFMDIPTYPLKPVSKPDFATKGNLLVEWNAQSGPKIDKEIQKYMDFYQMEGVAFAAFKDGKIIYEQTYGVRNNYTGEAVTDQTLFEVASITKPVFAFAALRLWEKGVFDLDKPLHEYLVFEEIADMPYAKLVTARHVLTHQTGLPNWGWDGGLRFKFKPGTDFGYSGEGFEYLKRVLVKITGKEMNQILEEEVKEPLGIKDMYFQYDSDAFPRKSHGHYNGYPGLIDFPDQPGVAWSLVTNPQALSKFIFALQDRKGLKPETFELMFSTQTKVPEDFAENNWNAKEHVGIGIFVAEAAHGKVIKHSGNNGDFKAVFRLYDGLDMGYIVMVNGNTGHFILDNIEKALIDPEQVLMRD
ncbi:MAG: serine hydrolase [Bacteroidota bacterium]